jgi:hypothetical protein
MFATSDEVLEMSVLLLDNLCLLGFSGSAHLSVTGEVDLECLSVVLESERCHREQDVFAVDSLSLLLLALLRS